MENVDKLYGLIGFPLTHSFSKKYFTDKFREEGITDTRYELFSLKDIEELPALLQAHPNLRGLNVTIPYKQQVLVYLDDVSALPLLACNCITIEGGKLKGYNTDIAGFEQSFAEKLLPHQTKALVLGTGGAAAAVQYVLQKLHIDFKSVSRGNGAHLNYGQLDEAVMAEHFIVINTTPLGTYPNIDDCADIPYHLLTPAHYCYDLVYNPPMSLFLQKSLEQGASIKNGSDMLKIQADVSWDIWNGSV
ncbi:MAG: shikimate dehydrogenase [Chitinophagaceae bacterium]